MTRLKTLNLRQHIGQRILGAHRVVIGLQAGPEAVAHAKKRDSRSPVSTLMARLPATAGW